MKHCSIKRKTPLRRVSNKQHGLLIKYGKLRKAYLLSHPKCEACVILGNREPMPSTEIHHLKGRGKYLNDVSTFIASCRWCHRVIHNYPNTARKLGLLK